jgi:hypothetical protein
MTKKLMPVKGTGFSPYIKPTKKHGALAPEGTFSVFQNPVPIANQIVTS